MIATASKGPHSAQALRVMLNAAIPFRLGLCISNTKCVSVYQFLCLVEKCGGLHASMTDRAPVLIAFVAAITAIVIIAASRSDTVGDATFT